MRLGGVTEVAEILGVSRQRLAKLREKSDFPDPIDELAQGAIWDLDVIEQWNDSGLRQSYAGRPRSSVAARTLGGRFVLEEPRIGHGGFADVYRALDKKAGRRSAPVAVKVLRDIESVEPEAIRRFKRELRILEGLEHPNVIPVIAHGETDQEGIWYAMPLAQGSLAGSIEDFDGDRPAILDLMRQVCDGLAHVHSEGVIHRDLKPGNILRTADGEWAISDFGLAVEAERQTTRLTSTLRAGLGSWWYTAPEQWRQASLADQRSDIYSLGKVLQELATGEPPVNNEMPPDVLRPIVEKATANQPSQRYRDVSEFLAALEMAIDGPSREWESADDAAKRLSERVRQPQPAIAALNELQTWAQALDENDHDDMNALARVFPLLSSWSIEQLWALDTTAFTRLFERFAHTVETTGWPWDFCDVLADFIRRVVDATGDQRILRLSVAALAELGESHNRWHVRDVLTSMLQGLRSGESAVAALEGLRDASRSAVEWSTTDFSLRSMHPALRAGIATYLAEEEAS